MVQNGGSFPPCLSALLAPALPRLMRAFFKFTLLIHNIGQGIQSVFMKALPLPRLISLILPMLGCGFSEVRAKSPQQQLRCLKKRSGGLAALDYRIMAVMPSARGNKRGPDTLRNFS